MDVLATGQRVYVGRAEGMRQTLLAPRAASAAAGRAAREQIKDPRAKARVTASRLKGSAKANRDGHVSLD